MATLQICLLAACQAPPLSLDGEEDDVAQSQRNSTVRDDLLYLGADICRAPSRRHDDDDFRVHSHDGKYMLLPWKTR